jgi:hypothetical protein
MSLPDLMAGIDLTRAFRDEVAALLVRKAQSSEVGNGARIAALDDFITREWAWANSQDMRVRPDPVLRAEAEAMFRAFVKSP